MGLVSTSLNTCSGRGGLEGLQCQREDVVETILGFWACCRGQEMSQLTGPAHHRERNRLPSTPTHPHSEDNVSLLTLLYFLKYGRLSKTASSLGRDCCRRVEWVVSRVPLEDVWKPLG